MVSIEGRFRAMLGLAAAFLGAACLPSAPSGGASLTGAARPLRPEGCREVAAGTKLQEALSSAAGGALCLAPGGYQGPVALPEGTALWGPPEAVIRSTGEGTTVTLSSGTRLLGLTVDGSGGRFDVLDAAVKLDKGVDVEVIGVTVKNAVFGILIEQAKRVVLRGNHVIGSGQKALGLRGDGIRIWETYDSLLEHNLVEDSRDLVVWYSSRNVLRDNEVRHGRYGTHFMYSHDNTVERCRYIGNEVGVFVMYSRDVRLLGNLLLDSSGASGMGLGMKESGNVTVKGNTMVHNTLGIFVDNSPITLGEANLFEDNEVRLGDVGVAFLSTTKDNAFVNNTFADNHIPVRVESGGDAMALRWEGNAFDDYAGYDLDRDGVGDLPYELSDLSNVLEQRNGDLAFLRGTPAMALVSVAGHAVPLLAPKPVLRDERPRMGKRGRP
jgi:nitrous oxidase accessory protein